MQTDQTAFYFMLLFSVASGALFSKVSEAGWQRKSLLPHTAGKGKVGQLGTWLTPVKYLLISDQEGGYGAMLFPSL